MLGISWIDWLVLVIYFIGITSLGVWTYKKVKSSADFFMGNRRFGKILMIAQAFGVGTHTDQPVTVTGASYTAGLAGIWYQWMWMFSTPFFWLIAPIYRRLRYITMADFFFERYGRSLAVFFALMGVVYFSMDIGIMLKGTGITIEGLTGGVMARETVIIGATVLFVLYGLAGGLVAAVITDLIQGILILVLSFLLIPFAISEAGGMEAIHRGLPEQMFSLVAPHEVTLFFIIMIVINGLVGIVVQPHHMAIGGSGKTEIACRSGWTFGTFIKRFATLGWAFTGVFAAFLYAGLTVENRELAFGIMARNLLPTGLIGLMLAALMAAVMSTCDAFMVHSSALITRNVYLPYINPGASDRQLLTIGRITSILTVAGGILFAFIFPSVVQGLIEVWKVTAYLGVAFWLGIMWKRANRYGAWSSAIVMALASIITGNILDWPLPQQIALYIPLGFAVMVIVSRLTKPEPEEKLRQFYLLLDTPVGKEQVLRDANVDIKLEGISQPKKPTKLRNPETHEAPDADDGLLIVDLFSLRKKFRWDRYRTDILGFTGMVILVILLIWLAVFLAGIGA
jgi:Na+/proline symporter